MSGFVEVAYQTGLSLTVPFDLQLHVRHMAFTSSQLLAASLVSFTVYVLLRRKRKHPFPFPPGPKSFPLIGNLRDLPFEYQWFAYEKWGREMGKRILFS